MSAKIERMQRRHRQGAIVDFDSSMELKRNGSIQINGEIFAEHVDGRLVRMPRPRLDFTIKNGRIVR